MTRVITSHTPAVASIIPLMSSLSAAASLTRGKGSLGTGLFSILQSGAHPSVISIQYICPGGVFFSTVLLWRAIKSKRRSCQQLRKEMIARSGTERTRTRDHVPGDLGAQLASSSDPLDEGREPPPRRHRRQEVRQPPRCRDLVQVPHALPPGVWVPPNAHDLFGGSICQYDDSKLQFLP